MRSSSSATSRALTRAIAQALRQEWDRERIVAHARANGWDQRVAAVIAALEELARHSDRSHGGRADRPAPRRA